MSSVDATAAGGALEWRAWLELARVSNAPTAVSNAIAGSALAAAGAGAGQVAPLALAIVLFYTAGMVLNDVLDLEVDRRRRPERPLPSGRVSRGAAVVAALALLAAGEALLLVAEPRAGLAGAVLIAAILAYDAWHEGNPLAPLLMGSCRALVYVVAALAVAGSIGAGTWLAAALLGLYVAVLTEGARSGPAWLRRRLGYPIAAIALYDALVATIAGGGVVAVGACLAAFPLTLALQTRIAGH